MNQTQMILDHLQNRGSISPREAMQDYGCMRLGARIWDLKAAGWPIVKTMERGENRFGDTTCYARYWMGDKING